MDATDCPNILVIDDEEIERFRIQSLTAAISDCIFKVRSPDEAKEADLRAASLVLVDYKLDNWETNAPEEDLCKHIPNGLALIGILQQRVMAWKDSHAVAFAIHSAHLPELTAPFKHEPRIHLLSQTCNIDWAFEKDSKSRPTDTLEKIRCLAEAVRSLPNSWPPAEATATRAELKRLLGIDTALQWADHAWSDVERARPPVDELILRVHGLLFLRWMLHRVLSYPCFLLDETWLAARLAVTPASVQVALSSGLGELLEPAEYRGILSGFRGRRWWRMGVENILWEIGGETSLGVDQLRHLLIEKKGLPLTPTEASHPVVCLDTDFLPLDQLHDPIEAVRIVPDDWPPFAEQAWVTIELALGDNRINGLVIEDDRPRLGERKREEGQ